MWRTMMRMSSPRLAILDDYLAVSKPHFDHIPASAIQMAFLCVRRTLFLRRQLYWSYHELFDARYKSGAYIAAPIVVRTEYCRGRRSEAGGRSVRLVVPRGIRRHSCKSGCERQRNLQKRKDIASRVISERNPDIDARHNCKNDT